MPGAATWEPRPNQVPTPIHSPPATPSRVSCARASGPQPSHKPSARRTVRDAPAPMPPWRVQPQAQLPAATLVGTDEAAAREARMATATASLFTKQLNVLLENFL